MHPSANEVPEETNWADYCDALRAERWLRLLDAAKQRKRAGYRSPSLGDFSSEPGAQSARLGSHNG